jgi:hypothetical protein
MKATNVLITALISFLIGAWLGSTGLHQLTKEEGVRLREQIHQREQRIDSLHAVTLQLTDSLQHASQIKIIEKIKYYEIKPKSYSVPALDSFFVSRYR